MKRVSRRAAIWIAATLVVMILVAGVWVRPASYSLSTDRLRAWTSYGGVWSLNHGVFGNNSDDRGAKLMSGSYRWSDISFEADVRMDQRSGDAGLMVRSNDEDLGVDAYNGYYAGLRGWEETLIAGRSNYGWSEVQPVAMPGGVRADVWYHLHLVMVGCRLGVSARNLSTGQSVALVLREDDCVRTGRVGLRSLSSGSVWRNLAVRRGTEAELDAIAAQAHGEELPQPLTTEAAYALHFSDDLPMATQSADSVKQPQTPLHIGDVTVLRGGVPQHVTVRGVVTLTAPDLYIEDPTGGAMIRHFDGPPVNVGEGVEVSGEVHSLDYSAMLDHASLRIVSSGAPAPPVSVTPWQAASGAYDARFIEVEGHLTSEPRSENGSEVLDLAEGGETFRALLPDQSRQALRALRPNSLLRLRGVCVLGHSYTQDLIPFLIFLRSPDDVQVLQDPPWWTPRHVAMVAVFVLFFACSMQLAYFRVRQWRQNAILMERERIAHDIHDTMAQSFAGIGYQIQGLRTLVVRDGAVTRTQIAEQLTSTSELVSRCHVEASHTIEMLAARSPEEAGDLLGILTERTYKLSSGAIHVSNEEQGEVRPLSTRVCAVLVHIGQEAISNAITHGQPSTIMFTLRFEARSATLMIADDGCGFDAVPEGEGFGILGMRHRAREISGTVEILSAPGVGTRVGVTFPLSRFSFADALRRLRAGRMQARSA